LNLFILGRNKVFNSSAKVDEIGKKMSMEIANPKSDFYETGNGGFEK
jgi:hypothetical protein